MSAWKSELYIVLIAVSALAFLSLMTDISSAESDDPLEADFGRCPDPRQSETEPETDNDPAPEKRMMEGRNTVIIRPGQPSENPMDMVADFERMSAEKKALEDKGKDVKIQEMEVAPQNQSLYDAVKDIIGRDAFTDESADCDQVETVDASDIPETSTDSGFLAELADSLEDTDPETSHAIRSVLNLRAQHAVLQLVQELLSGDGTFSSRKTDDTDDDEEDEEPSVVVEEENEMPADVTTMSSVEMPFASCGTVGVVVPTEAAVGCSHGAADGPAL